MTNLKWITYLKLLKNSKHNMEIKYIKFNWNENFSIAASEKYLKSVSSEYGWIGGFIQGELKFALPFIIKKRLFFRFLQFQTNTIYLDNSLNIKEEKIFLNKVIEFLQDKNIDFIKQSPKVGVFNICPDDSICAPFGSYILDLRQTEDKLWAGIHKKHRNIIRRAVNGGVKIVMGKEYIDAAFQLERQTMMRVGINFQREEITQLQDFLNRNLAIFVAMFQDKPQGCAIMPFSQSTAYYFYGGLTPNAFPGSLNLLHWEAIKYFKSINVCYYDFVGARINPKKELEGIQRFKSRFGGELKKGYLWKYSLKKWKYSLYRPLFYLKNRRKGDIIDEEKNKYEEFCPKI